MDKQDRFKSKGYDDKCVHFNGIMNKRCDAGVSYADLVPEMMGRVLHLPCFKDNADAVACTSCHYPTPEEVAQHEAELAAHMEAMRHRAAILKQAHTDDARSAVFWCQLCDALHTVGTDAQQHLKDAHGVVGPFQARMLAHLDATGWYQTDDMLSVDGRDVLVRSIRLQRTGASKALWAADDTPKKPRKRR